MKSYPVKCYFLFSTRGKTTTNIQDLKSKNGKSEKLLSITVNIILVFSPKLMTFAKKLALRSMH